jgi:hypothetical protein
MKQKLFFLLGFVALVLVVVGTIRMIAGRGPKDGELKVDSQPSAAVFLNDKHIGRTPYKEKTAAGEYTVKIVPEGGVTQLASWEGKITIGQNLLTYVNADLTESELSSAIDVLWLEKITSNQSELVVTSNPDGASVLLDDETKGVAPLTIPAVSAGDHTLTVTSPGFVTRTIKIKTTAGYRLLGSIKLALFAGATPTPEASPSPTISGTPKVTPTGSPKVTPTKSASTVADPPKPFVIIKETPTGFLRVRMEPSTSASEAGRVNPGEKYTIFDTSGSWYQIKYNGTNEGWISGQYAEKVE